MAIPQEQRLQPVEKNPTTNTRNEKARLKTGPIRYGKSGREDLNLRPPAPKAGALARLRYAPYGV